MSVIAEDIIRKLSLSPHPEGGFFRETFRAPLNGERSSSTAIYYLLPAGTFSAFHKVKNADEVWHYYLGDSIELHMLYKDGHHTVARLGPDILAGEQPQVVVPANTLQAAVVVGKDFSLCGCTVAPGFNFEDFVIPSRSELEASFPQHKEIIARLTRK